MEMYQRVRRILEEYQGTLGSYWKYRKDMVNGVEHVDMTSVGIVLCDRIVRGVGAEEIRRAVHVAAAALIAERRAIASKIATNDHASRDIVLAVREHCGREALRRIADWTRYQCSRDGVSTEEWEEALNDICSEQ